MEVVNYTSGLLWLCSWPILIYIAYHFCSLNMNHFEEHLKEK